MLVQRRRRHRAALRLDAQLLKSKALRRNYWSPTGLGSYASAFGIYG